MSDYYDGDAVAREYLQAMKSDDFKREIAGQSADVVMAKQFGLLLKLSCEHLAASAELADKRCLADARKHTTMQVVDLLKRMSKSMPPIIKKAIERRTSTGS